MTLHDYHYWLGVARKFSRRKEEGEDLLHDALAVALDAGRSDFSVDGNKRWFYGVLRNHGAMTARSEHRRREREKRGAAEGTAADTSESLFSPALFRSFPPSARTTALLIAHGMSREEIVYALGLTPTSWRQRLSTIRKTLRRLDPDIRSELTALACYRRPDIEHLELGLVRRALHQQLRESHGVGAHDPDGHLLLFRPG